MELFGARPSSLTEEGELVTDLIQIPGPDRHISLPDWSGPATPALALPAEALAVKPP